MSNTETNAGLSAPPGPPKDRPGKPVPPHIEDLLRLLHILLAYARHLSLTLERRSTAWGFSVIAQFFGTPNVPHMLARIARGIRRIQALQRVLLDRARRGRDLAWLPLRQPRPRPPSAPPATQPDGTQPAARPPRRRRPPAPDPTEALPSVAQLEAEARRHPIGWSVAEICRDLGVAPTLCSGPLWTALFDTIRWYGGHLPRFLHQLRQEQLAFAPQTSAAPPLRLPEETREGVRRMLGFFIGEQWPIMPYPVPLPRRLLREAATTGPP